MNYRQPIVLSGSNSWGIATAIELLTRLKAKTALWVGKDQGFKDSSIQGVKVVQAKQAVKLIGSEFELLIFDAWSGLHVDALAAVAGTLKGGGILLLLTPDLDEWHNFSDPDYSRLLPYPTKAEQVKGRFIKRFCRCIVDCSDIVVVKEEEALPNLELQVNKCKITGTIEQQQAVAAVVKVVTGQRRRPVVLLADRGRGKSYALGAAACEVLEQFPNSKIMLTAPSKLSAAEVLQHSGVIKYLSPDELLQTLPDLSLLLIDEAAAIPLPQLEKLLRHYPRIAFATTVHGYEGTGQGFLLKFKKILDRATRGWKQINLQKPIRWDSDDPLEKFIFDSLLLRADIDKENIVVPPVLNEGYIAAAVSVEAVARDQLLEDEQLLEELFGVLLQSHYRTTPFDLRNLLDGPNIIIYKLTIDGKIAGAVLAAKEGGLNKEIAKDVEQGKRRPRGHLIPELLTIHLGLTGIMQYRCLRILRVAVHPQLQRRGLGGLLVKYVVIDAEHREYDYIGSSFSANPELLEFWHRAGFKPVRCSIKRSAASASHSVVELLAISQSGEEICRAAQGRFKQLFPLVLGDQLSDLDPELTLSILTTINIAESSSGKIDGTMLQKFANGDLDYEAVMPELMQFTMQALTAEQYNSLLSKAGKKLLLTKVIQHHSWQKCVSALQLNGKADLMKKLREQVKQVISTL